MTKPRKRLGDSLANEFVFGDQAEPQPENKANTSSENKQPKSKTAKANPSKDIMSKLSLPEKEATIRLTVDLSESMHRKLSLLAARTGRKKVDIVRMLLDEALQEVDE